MKLHYFPEIDSLYIELKSTPGAQAREIVEGLVVDLDAGGDVVGIDIDHASRKLDLSKIETIALPAVTTGSRSAVRMKWNGMKGGYEVCPDFACGFRASCSTSSSAPAPPPSPPTCLAVTTLESN